MLKIRGLKKTFGNTLVLKGVDLDILEGEIVVVVGPSGGGKTTLLRIITGLEKCDDGSIEISGNTLCKDGKYCDKKTANIIRKDVGLVFQSFNLFPHKSVLENIIEAPIRVLGEKKENAINKALEILNFLGLSHKANNYPCELSGGQKQRVAIIRTLIIDPDIILFDEPTSALDPEMIGEVLELIKGIANTGKTMMIVSHEMGFVKNVSNRVLFLEDGKILFDGKTKDFFDSSNDRIKGFLKKIEN